MGQFVLSHGVPLPRGSLMEAIRTHYGCFPYSTHDSGGRGRQVDRIEWSERSQSANACDRDRGRLSGGLAPPEGADAVRLRRASENTSTRMLEIIERNRKLFARALL